MQAEVADADSQTDERRCQHNTLRLAALGPVAKVMQEGERQVAAERHEQQAREDEQGIHSATPSPLVRDGA